MSATDQLTTRDGATLVARPIHASDRSRLAEHFGRLSPETRYRRFLGVKQSLTERELTEFTVVDHHDREALVALDPEGQLVAVARYIALEDRPGAAEVAVTVADEWQHRGVGTALLSRLIARAEDEGIVTFVASCLADNADMITLFRDLGDSVRRTGGGAATVELEIALPTDADHLVRPALRAAATMPSLTASIAPPGPRS